MRVRICGSSSIPSGSCQIPRFISSALNLPEASAGFAACKRSTMRLKVPAVCGMKSVDKAVAECLAQAPGATFSVSVCTTLLQLRQGLSLWTAPLRFQ
eukprot:458362-Pyramimonas_sp.AAC.1